MNRNEIVNNISFKHNLPKDDVNTVVVEFMNAVKEANIKGETVYLRGFGTFGLRTRKSQVARDICRGKSIDIKESVVPKFKPCNNFKNNVIDNVKPE
jgi:DNA-binding protein HU-beta